MQHKGCIHRQAIARIYSYAGFDRARAFGLEAKAEAPAFARYGVTGYLNYAPGRVYFYNPVTGGFVTEADHLAEASRFLAPMDQTHTLTAGVTYRHTTRACGLERQIEYGSGTPMDISRPISQRGSICGVIETGAPGSRCRLISRT